MKRLLIPALLALVLFLAITAGAFALDASAESVETAVVYRGNGQADVTSRIEWTASGSASNGQMHGFYYQGDSDIVSFDMDRCWADIPGGERL
ncbi:MAG: hypothetical protein LBT11_04060, partial [Treponema sp.]|nr:hypothetical protein [Treponema sp.]